MRGALGGGIRCQAPLGHSVCGWRVGVVFRRSGLLRVSFIPQTQNGLDRLFLNC